MIEIEHKDFRALILKQGAQLVEFCITDEKPLLWRTDLSYYEEGKAFRGGVPICWPWFGKAQTPAHGFARIIVWELVKREEDEKSVNLEWRVSENEHTLAIWNHPFELRLKMHLSKEGLEMFLHVRTDVETTGALHSYFFTEDVASIKVQGLGECYTDTLEQNSLHVSAPLELTIQSEVDRIYLDAQEKNSIKEEDRTVEITHKNNSDVVVWNPDKDLADMQKNTYKNLICIETARINTLLKSEDFLGFTCKSVKSSL